jgi:hypothetical protein
MVLTSVVAATVVDGSGYRRSITASDLSQTMAQTAKFSATTPAAARDHFRTGCRIASRD